MSFKRYVSAERRQIKSARETNKLEQKGVDTQPVIIQGRTIASSFWGKSWCQHIESFSDYENRLPRGRSYVRNNAVCHLEIGSGSVSARVSGTRLYRVSVLIKPLSSDRWEKIKKLCQGKVGSLIDLLNGKISDEVMKIVTDKWHGLFPLPSEIEFSCSCPDWASMCKHVASVLYGIGNRLDSQPELLFLLRGVNPQEMLGSLADSIPAPAGSIAENQLSDIFGIDIDEKKEVIPKPAESRVSSSSDEFTGPMICSIRKKAGLSVSSFAELLNVSDATVRRWEATAGHLKMRQSSLTELMKLISYKKPGNAHA